MVKVRSQVCGGSVMITVWESARGGDGECCGRDGDATDDYAEVYSTADQSYYK